MTRIHRVAAALAGTAALVVSGIAPAASLDWVHEDAIGDVQVGTFDSDTDIPELVQDPDNVDTDITRLAVRHRDHQVSLRMTFRDIRRSSGFAVFDIRTDDRRYWAIKSLGRQEFMPGWMLVRANGRPVRCPEASRYVKRDQEQAVARIPRRCLGFPEWVRVGAGAQSFSETRRSFTIAIDDALSEGEFRDRLVAGPRVYRGEAPLPQ